MKKSLHDWSKVVELAHARFGFDDFRPGQVEALRAVLDERDTLAVMPTGSGKSAIYQIAGLLTAGSTVVVSPLIALQRDQVDMIASLVPDPENGAGKAAEVNSTLSDSARDATFQRLHDGEIEFIFLAPEQFGNEETMARLVAATPSLVVVDEAHCSSEWGHDFRPDYLRLGAAIERLGHPTTLALTATAAPLVRKEIVERLGMREPDVIVRGFDRPNIHLAVETFRDEDDKRAALLGRVAASDKPGIVYAATHRDTEELATALTQQGIAADAYHAGLKAADRNEVQSAFMADELEVIVATIAFGMGIDKPNVRFVYHHDISESIDAYHQEIGRAGRDGERADAVLFYLPDDLKLRRFQVGAGQLDEAEVQRVFAVIGSSDGPINARDLSEPTGLTDSHLTKILNRLDETGSIRLHANGDVSRGKAKRDPDEAAHRAMEAQDTLRQYAYSRIEMMRQYAEMRDCRREFLLNYFGEAFDGACGFCDACEAGRVAPEDEAKQPFPVSSRVRHRKWGEGAVTHYEDDTMVALFDSVSYRILGINLATADGLLTPAE